jgi:histidine triad (HIT) family protein
VENAFVVAFPHPTPTFDDHLLVVPKKAIPTFVDLLSPNNISHWVAILEAACQILKDRGWSEYSIGVNGGAYQDVAQVHFHIYRGMIHWRKLTDTNLLNPILSEEGSRVYPHSDPKRKLHLVICVDTSYGFSDLQQTVADLVERNDLIELGYTVFVETEPALDHDILLHLVSG